MTFSKPIFTRHQRLFCLGNFHRGTALLYDVVLRLESRCLSAKGPKIWWKNRKGDEETLGTQRFQGLAVFYRCLGRLACGFACRFHVAKSCTRQPRRLRPTSSLRFRLVRDFVSRPPQRRPGTHPTCRCPKFCCSRRYILFPIFSNLLYRGLLSLSTSVFNALSGARFSNSIRPFGAITNVSINLT